MFSKKEFGIVSNLRFISMRMFMLSWVEHKKVFITSGLYSQANRKSQRLSFLYKNVRKEPGTSSPLKSCSWQPSMEGDVPIKVRGANSFPLK